LVDRAGLRRDQPGGDLLRADPDPDHPEVGVVAAALPEPGAGHGRPEALRVRVPVEQRLPLLPDRLADLGALVAERAHVLAAGLDHLSLARSGTLTEQLDAHHAEDRRAVHAAGDVG